MMNYLQDVTYETLKHYLWNAEEMEDGRFINAIKAEINRRNRDE